MPQQIIFNGPVTINGGQVQIFQGSATAQPLDNRTDFSSGELQEVTSTEPIQQDPKSDPPNKCPNCNFSWDVLIGCFKDVVIAIIGVFTL